MVQYESTSLNGLLIRLFNDKNWGNRSLVCNDFRSTCIPLSLVLRDQNRLAGYHRIVITLTWFLPLYVMMASSHGIVFRVTGHLCGEFTIYIVQISRFIVPTWWYLLLALLQSGIRNHLFEEIYSTCNWQKDTFTFYKSRYWTYNSLFTKTRWSLNPLFYF